MRYAIARSTVGRFLLNLPQVSTVLALTIPMRSAPLRAFVHELFLFRVKLTDDHGDQQKNDQQPNQAFPEPDATKEFGQRDA